MVTQLRTPTPENQTGLPSNLKSGIEALSGVSLNDTRVHYNSGKPSQLHALAYTQGSDIHLGAGQEKHLAHEAWHVVQQKQGRVRPTLHMSGQSINDDRSLEREADMMGSKALQFQLAEGSPALSPGASPSFPVVQRKQVNLDDYLDEAIADNQGDPEWDPQWTWALTELKQNSQYREHLPKTLDDVNADDAEKLVAVLRALAGLGGGTPNVYRLAQQAIQRHAKIESTGQSTGMATLSVAGGSLTGRPDFPTGTKQQIPLLTGQHRRHVLAWHSIRGFIDLAYQSRKALLLQTIRANLPNASIQAAVTEGTKALGKDPSVPQPLTDEETLKLGLFVMNGNPRNLWAGKGSVNSAINTAQGHLNKSLAAAQSLANLQTLVGVWEGANGKPVYKMATTLAASVLKEALADVQGFVEPTQEPQAVTYVKSRIHHWVISNLEIDSLGDSKAQNQVAVSKFLALQAPINTVWAVESGEVAFSDVPDTALEKVIQEYMTY
ncbi:DUF4157 domain-containing protein [Stigmatella sp. ncwal1]|uniref:DUF4157 domain-containing protein n=1 Tax=Stigmatella ashevillensis TaxID=2995309 RepID=A0ABT5DI34_9BACT|nr:DUF4157 domain-containing protein [Stigmatella ashevillena]MDC0713317.1 DUF4157 domain-containing protein [Stigmatella ashevillena]